MKTLPRFLLFCAVGFGPLILAYMLLIFGLLLNAVISVLGTSPADGVRFAYTAAISLALLGGGLWAAFSAFYRISRWPAQAAILYVFWLGLVAIAAFFLAASLAGISMANMDGSLTRDELLWISLREAARMVALAHLGILPWILGATWGMRRLERPDM